VTRLSLLLSSGLLVLAFAGAANAATAPIFDARHPSTAGSYLAGQQALFDMKTAAASQYMQDALEGGWENPNVVQTAMIAFAANGDIAEAADAARHMVELDPSNELARLVVATEHLKEKRFDEVISELSKVGVDSFAGITGGILRAWAFVGEKKLDEGLASLDEVGKNGLDDFLVFHRALMADVGGEPDRAIEFAAKAYEVDPYVARIVEAYSRMLGNAGRFDEAEGILKAFASEGLNHPLVDVVRTAVDKKQRPGVFAPDEQTGAAEMFHGIGVALAREGNAELALVFLRLGLYLDPHADVIALVLGQFLDDSGEHIAANTLYDNVPATSPMKPTAVVRIAENLDSMGNRDEAIRRLGNIVHANPTDLDALSVLGDLQRTDKRYGEAAATYTQALSVAGGENPGDWRFYYVRGIAYERNKEWPKAEADFQKALKLRPDQPQVLNYLGYSWVDQGINLAPALEMIEKAVAAAPNDGYIIDSLGWAFYRLGRYDEAVQTLEQAVMLRPNDPEINDHLGDAYWRAGRKLEARFQYNVASAVDTEDGDVRKRVAAKLSAPTPGPLDTPVTEETPAADPATGAETTPVDAPEEPAAKPEAPAVKPEAAAEPEPAPAPEVAEAPAVPQTPAAVEKTVTVAPGDNLWTIARDAYGSGAQFTLIVEANDEKLGDPSRIKPGLVLVLPAAP
jgi:tetratricopeptide (TPR) repeat protein